MDTKLRIDKIASALKILGHKERLRIVVMLSRGELTVSELVQILGVSQPRITQYVKSLEEAGIVERLEEGSWVFSRIKRSDPEISTIVSAVLKVIPLDERVIETDFQRLADVRRARAALAEQFFADVANNKGQLSEDYLPHDDIEAAMRQIAGEGPFQYMIDLGTGTGRILQLFADRILRGLGIDNNVDMLKVARHNLTKHERTHLRVQRGDLAAVSLEAGIADFVTLHQVLHYLENPQEAIAEAGRLLMPGGRLLITDFASHNFEIFRERFAHRRLGFSEDIVADWMKSAGIVPDKIQKIDMGAERPDVVIWSGRLPA